MLCGVDCIYSVTAPSVTASMTYQKNEEESSQHSRKQGPLLSNSKTESSSAPAVRTHVQNKSTKRLSLSLSRKKQSFHSSNITQECNTILASEVIQQSLIPSSGGSSSCDRTESPEIAPVIILGDENYQPALSLSGIVQTIESQAHENDHSSATTVASEVIQQSPIPSSGGIASRDRTVSLESTEIAPVIILNDENHQPAGSPSGIVLQQQTVSQAHENDHSSAQSSTNAEAVSQNSATQVTGKL